MERNASSVSSTNDESGCFGWFARGDRMPLEARIPFNRPTLRQVYDSLPFIRRYFIYWLKHLGKKEKLFINTFQPLRHKPHYGVPCGGIGCGSIGRDFRGGFCKFGLRPGLIEHKVDVLKADQFILTLRKFDSERHAVTVYQKVLCAAPFASNSGGELASWDFSFPPQNLAYRGLYPRSWTRYEIPEHNVAVTLRQISPVIPDDYSDSSLPVSVFIFDFENNSDNDLEASITFTFRNGTGYHKWSQEGNCSSGLFESGISNSVQGVCLDHTISKMRCTFAVAALAKEGTRVSRCTSFNPSKKGEKLWTSLRNNGDLSGEGDLRSPRELGIAVCAQSILKANSKSEARMEFSLAWDMPVVHFGSRKRVYRRRFTRFFGDKGDAAPALCAHALQKYGEWEGKIEKWQNPVLSHPHLPDWYKSALFNELYFMTDGGSVWFEFDDNWRNEERQLSPYSVALMKEHGRFGYLESWEYRMVNTYDVHFYASFALAQLWPHLEHVLQAEFTDQIEHFDGKSVIYHMEGDRGPKKSRTRVPHDLGNPAVDPWLRTNAYVMHDTGKWKDLNLKFVLTSYRDYYCVLDKDQKFLKTVWPVIKSMIEDGLTNWDKDGDGMIENFGVADQTYDAWKMAGVSAYCGSLWLAALCVTSIMAEDVGDTEAAARYSETLERAREAFSEKLWNGEYYNFDERSRSHDTIMADQLCGYWFVQSISPDLAQKLLPTVNVKKVLNKIFNFNVLRFAGGRLGAVNGMRNDGTVDRNYIQADEVWTGITYALAAFFIQQGDIQRGFDTAWGCYDGCFNRFGLQYQTPEALYERRFYRAIGYMRPLSIWAMQWALERHCRIFTDESIVCQQVRSGMPTSSPADAAANDGDDDVEGVMRLTEGPSCENSSCNAASSTASGSSAPFLPSYTELMTTD